MLNFHPPQASGRVKRGIVALACVTVAAGLVLGSAPAANADLPVTVINTDGQGVASRPGPHLSPTNGYGAPAGASVSTICWAWGDAVGPYNNRLWWDISYAGRQFYASDHYLSTPDSGQPPAGQPQCNAGSAPVAPDESVWYTLTARNSNKDLDVRWGTAANGTAVQQYWANGTKAQQWRFVHTDSGYYQLVSALTGNRVLDVRGWGTANWTKVQTWDWAGGANQQWEPFDAGNGYVTLKPRHVGRCLDVPGGSQNAWVQLQIYDCNGTASQQFYLTAVASIASPASTNAVAWANNQIGQTSYPGVGNWSGKCETFVEMAYGTSGKYYSAALDYQAQLNQGRMHPATDLNPPAGALAFYAYGSDGHVALSIGGGQIVGTFGGDGAAKPVGQSGVSSAARGLTYLGWAYAPTGWPGR